jgi:flavodoxin
MVIMSKLLLAYFSATGTTKTIVEALAKGFKADAISRLDFTNLSSRAEDDILVDKDTTVVFAGPVFAGRIQTDAINQFKRIKGNGNAICVCVYGNRDFDDALIELYDTAINNGFNVIGNGAFIGEHSFAHITDFDIAQNRPDSSDLIIAKNFGKDIFKKITDGKLSSIEPKGNRPYKDGMPNLLATPDTLLY